MQQDLVAELLAVAEAAQTRELRVAARLLARALQEKVLRENLPDLQVVTTLELGPAVGAAFERLAKERKLLPSPRERLIHVVSGRAA